MLCLVSWANLESAALSVTTAALDSSTMETQLSPFSETRQADLIVVD